MKIPPLSRCSLARVLQSLLEAELQNVRDRSDRPRLTSTQDGWPDHLQLAGDDGRTLACDSLELLWLSSAVNEMFHLYQSNEESDLLSAATFGEWMDIIQSSWQSGVTGISFRTSGSTGPTKSCAHEFTYLSTEVRYLAELFAQRKRIVSLARSHHIYGFLFTAMLADELNVEVLQADGMSPSRLVRELQEGDLLVTIPDTWRWLQRSIPRWPERIHGVVSTAPCPTDLVPSLIDQNLDGMTEVYGSSETAGIATRRWPLESYQLMPHWQRAKSGDQSQSLIHSCGKRFEPMDTMVWHGSDRFTLGGRLDLAVQVGGTNVYPDQIAASLNNLPGVKESAVRSMRSTEGSRLKAFIVPSPEWLEEDVRREVRVWAESNLKVVERPKSLRFGPALPVNEFGKSCDWET